MRRRDFFRTGALGLGALAVDPLASLGRPDRGGLDFDEPPQVEE